MITQKVPGHFCPLCGQSLFVDDVRVLGEEGKCRNPKCSSNLRFSVEGKIVKGGGDGSPTYDGLFDWDDFT